MDCDCGMCMVSSPPYKGVLPLKKQKKICLAFKWCVLVQSPNLTFAKNSSSVLLGSFGYNPKEVESVFSRSYS